MAAQDRKRKSAPQNRAKSFISALTPIKPTADLNNDEYDRFNAIIASRERETWNPADIGTATHMAQIEVERDNLRAEYLAEGAMLDGKINQKFKLVDLLYGQIDRSRRALGLTASQRGISGHKQAKRNQQDTQAAEKISSLNTLIARPNVS